ncbi:MAG: dienelactone hydrolase family protein [Bryobacterales bacterium]|nr:dienelactone hydrolase family protein [Bryobacterales bacterium]
MNDHKDAHELAHLYVDGAFSRREMIRRARQIAGGVAMVSAALNSMGVPLRAQAPASCSADLRVPADAADIVGQDVQFAGDESPLFAYLVKPKREVSDPIPAVLVIHENRGLNEHIRDVTRRVARAGYIALGIDLLSRQGGTGQFTDPTQQTAAYGRTTPAGRLADLRKSVGYLRTLPDVFGDSIGTVGFCAGGANVWALAASGETTRANVVYYGAPPPLDQIPNIHGQMLCHYAQTDRNLTTQGVTTVAAMNAIQKRFGFHIWEGVGHAFNNDTGAAFNAKAACEAWNKTIEFYYTHLG